MPYDLSTTNVRRGRFLPKRSTLVLDGARGTVLAVDRGTLWVTLDGDPRDFILSRGTHFRIDRGGRTIVAAEQDSWLRLIRALTLAERLRAGIGRAKTAIDRAWKKVTQPLRAPYY